MTRDQHQVVQADSIGVFAVHTKGLNVPKGQRHDGAVGMQAGYIAVPENNTASMTSPAAKGRRQHGPVELRGPDSHRRVFTAAIDPDRLFRKSLRSQPGLSTGHAITAVEVDVVHDLPRREWHSVQRRTTILTDAKATVRCGGSRSTLSEAGAGG